MGHSTPTLKVAEGKIHNFKGNEKSSSTSLVEINDSNPAHTVASERGARQRLKKALALKPPDVLGYNSSASFLFALF